MKRKQIILTLTVITICALLFFAVMHRVIDQPEVIGTSPTRRELYSKLSRSRELSMAIPYFLTFGLIQSVVSGSPEETPLNEFLVWEDDTFALFSHMLTRHNFINITRERLDRGWSDATEEFYPADAEFMGGSGEFSTPRNPTNKPLVVLYPGLKNTVETNYVRSSICHILPQCDVLIVKHPWDERGIDSFQDMLSGFYDTQYIERAMIRCDIAWKDYYSCKVFIGCSMGSTIMFKYLSRPRNCVGVGGMISICAIHSTKLFTNQWNGVPTWKRIVYSLLMFQKAPESFGDSEPAIVINKFEDSAKYLKRVRVPTIIINCENDPLYNKAMGEVCRSTAKENDQILILNYKYGGHLGFFTGLGWTPNLGSQLGPIIGRVVSTLLDEMEKKYAEFY